MEPNSYVTSILKEWGLIAGIAGMALGVFLILFRGVIRKKIFPILTKAQAFVVIILFMILVWSVAIISIVIYFRGSDIPVILIPPEEDYVPDTSHNLINYYLALKNINYDLTPEGPAKYDEILKYFTVANPDFIETLEDLKTKKSSLTYVPAEAGYGKSWIGLSIIKEILSSEKISILDIKKDFVEKSAQDLSAIGITKRQEPNLQLVDNADNSKITLNELPSFKEDYRSLFSLLDTSKSVLIIDGLDEIHPNKAKDILTQIENRDSLQLKHIIVLARPELFSLRTVGRNGVKLIESLKPIEFGSFEDVKMRTDNWMDYYPEEKGIPPLSGRDRLKVQQNLIKILIEKPFLKQSIINSSNGLDLVDYIYSNPDQDYSMIDDYELMNTLKNGIFIRNAGTHNRPKPQDTNTDLYYCIFAKIATEYLERIDPKTGFFDVSAMEELTVKYLGTEYRFNVKNVLDLSGTIDIDPANSNYSKYIFQPFWLHEFFVKYGEKHLSD